MGVDGDEVKRIVDHAMTILVESGNDSGNAKARARTLIQGTGCLLVQEAKGNGAAKSAFEPCRENGAHVQRRAQLRSRQT